MWFTGSLQFHDNPSVRVIYVTPLYVPWVGGLENFSRQLIAHLRDRGHEIIVVTSNMDAEFADDDVDGVPVYRLPSHTAVETRDAKQVLQIQARVSRIAGDFKPDLVHAHDAGPLLWIYQRATRRRPRPSIVTVHNVMTLHFGGSLQVLAKLLRGADWVTGVSQAVVDDILTYEPSVHDRISVIRNAITPWPEPVFPVPDEPPHLLCMGRLVAQKGFDIALDAIAMVADRHPTLRLSIAGDGPQANALQRQTAQLGLADRVDFLGTVDGAEVPALLERSTAVLMPSRFEGLPLVAIETAWAGRPLVATSAPGMSEAILDGETGIVVEPENAAALADGINRLLTDDLVQTLGRATRARAEELYNLPKCVDAYESLYEEVVSRADVLR